MNNSNYSDKGKWEYLMRYEGPHQYFTSKINMKICLTFKIFTFKKKMYFITNFPEQIQENRELIKD